MEDILEDYELNDFESDLDESEVITMNNLLNIDSISQVGRNVGKESLETQQIQVKLEEKEDSLDNLEEIDPSLLQLDTDLKQEEKRTENNMAARLDVPRRGRKKQLPKNNKKQAVSQGEPKEHYNRKIYMCGSCLFCFKFPQELTLHIKKTHQTIPHGTVYGWKKQTLFRFFQLPHLIANTDELTKVRFRCGCGKIYRCSSSLRFHIHGVHKGVRPQGTIGANPRALKKKKKPLQ